MPKNSNKQQLYDVERILDKKLENGVVKYLVKWSGYSLDESIYKCFEIFWIDLFLDNFILYFAGYFLYCYFCLLFVSKILYIY
jgi:Chromo (CHRromatin Organisation MOdifier) domain